MTEFSQAEWLRDLAQAANDLGYYIEVMDYRGTVTLVPKANDRTRIVIESPFCSGDFLRATLHPVDVKVAA